MPSNRRAPSERRKEKRTIEGPDISRELLPADRMPDEFLETEQPGDQRPPPMSRHAEALTRPDQTPPGVGQH